MARNHQIWDTSKASHSELEGLPHGILHIVLELLLPVSAILRHLHSSEAPRVRRPDYSEIVGPCLKPSFRGFQTGSKPKVLIVGQFRSYRTQHRAIGTLVEPHRSDNLPATAF